MRLTCTEDKIMAAHTVLLTIIAMATIKYSVQFFFRNTKGTISV